MEYLNGTTQSVLAPREAEVDCSVVVGDTLPSTLSAGKGTIRCDIRQQFIAYISSRIGNEVVELDTIVVADARLVTNLGVTIAYLQVGQPRGLHPLLLAHTPSYAHAAKRVPTILRQELTGTIQSIVRLE